jgi:CspA family cold shock protein
MRGRVSAWHRAKSYGFITPNSGADVFVHIRAVIGGEYDRLGVGQEVEFDIVQAGDGRERAVNVKPIGK